MKTASLAPKGLSATAAEASEADSSSSRNHRNRNGNGWRSKRLYAGLGAALALVLLGLLSACSSDSKPAEEAKPEVKGPELITARSAFQKLYVAARGWNQDAKPYRLESTATSDGNGQDGKWAVWRCSFASATQRSEKILHLVRQRGRRRTRARRQSRDRRQL